MLGTLIEALKSIIDLLMKGREDRKLRLEIERLEQEKRENQSLIQKATIDDVKSFDPKIQLIRAKVKERFPDPSMKMKRSSLGWVCMVAVIGAIIGIILLFYLNK